jgi:AcrR family transcriptional regulator
MSEPVSRPVGRPRSAESRAALLDAAYWQTVERGYAGATAEAISKAAGAGKQTLYRWWPSKAALVLEAVTVKLKERIDRPRETSMRSGDVERFLLADFHQLRGFSDALAGLVLEARSDLELMRLLTAQWLALRLADLYVALTVAIPDARRREIAAEAIEGAILARILVGRPLDEAFARALAGLAKPPAPPT